MIEAGGLTKIYGSTTVLNDVTFTVEPGQILGFLGPNGAGKTTTMRILTGYLPATEGTARVAGFDVHEKSIAVRKRIGYLPEAPPLYPEMTVEGFLHFVARIKGVPSGNRRERVQWAIDRCSLEEKQKLQIRKLSKGFRQRVGIAQAIVHNPPVIVLDEPTVGLDPRQIIEVRNLIKSLAGDHTIILSTHILTEVSATCDRVAIINRGSLVTTDTLSNLTGALGNQWRYTVEIAHGETPFLMETVVEKVVDDIAEDETSDNESKTEEVTTEEVSQEDSQDEETANENTGEANSDIEAVDNEVVLDKDWEESEESEELGTEDVRWELTEFGRQWCDRFKEIPGVATVNPELNQLSSSDDVDPKRLRLQIHSHAEADPGQGIAAQVIREGLGLCEMRRDRPSLEEAFLRLTTAGYSATPTEAE
ncbi:MAG: ABC transporter ATP-binding protein [Cyanobacteria bacterium P01_F01_bin.153]